MMYEFIFLYLVIPGPDHPGPKLTVMLKPLIDKLKELWNGVEAYDPHKKQKFRLRAAYQWLIHDSWPMVILSEFCQMEHSWEFDLSDMSLRH
jgi:hypothetical protein